MQSQEIVDDIDAAYKQHDAGQISFQAHKLKSSARTVGADKLADLCLALEGAGQRDEWSEIDLVAPTMQPEMERVKRYIDSL